MNRSSPITEQITTHFGGEHRPEVFAKLDANESVLNALWKQYQSVMTEGEIDLQTKELIGLSVAITKPNEYVIGLQQRRMRRADIDEAAELEALAVVGLLEGFNSFAHALQIDSDLRPRCMEAGDTSLVDCEIKVNVPYVVETDDPTVSQVYDEIRTKLGLDFVPNVFKAMAHQPAMLQSKWESYKAIMLEGVLKPRTKEMIAITVSAVNGCSYCVDAHSTVCRQLGLSPQGLVEGACVIELFATLCTLAKGLRLGKKNF